MQLGLSPLLFCEDDAAEKKDENIPASANSQLSSKENKDSCSLRLCTVQKDPQGFGFNLNQDPQSPGILISEVGLKNSFPLIHPNTEMLANITDMLCCLSALQLASGGSAQKAGLVVGDIVLEINGQNVEEKCMKDVIELVEKEKSLLSILVKNQTSYETETEISDWF